ncbi:hypothetical protein JCM3770_006056 [Rhodotorula araucariae]
MQDIQLAAFAPAHSHPEAPAAGGDAPPPTVDPRQLALNPAARGPAAPEGTIQQLQQSQAPPQPSTSVGSPARSGSQPRLSSFASLALANPAINGAHHDPDVDQLVTDGGDDADSDRALASTSKPAVSTPTRPPAKRPNEGSPGVSTDNDPVTQQPRKKHRSSAAHGQRPSGYNPPPLPHYTVVRSTHNSRTSPHVIRIHDNASDGSESRWPAEHERRPDHKVQGRENWYECQDRDTGRHKSFREKLGEELAKKLGIASQTPGGKQEYWIVENLPKGHLFTVHHCVTSSNQPRLDVYIFGSSATLKFRTANEFTPHVYWLLQHGPDDSLRCECKYCSKMTQTDVNRILGLTESRGSSVASSSGTPRKAAASSASGLGSRDREAGSGTARVARAGDPGTEKLLPPLAGAGAGAKRGAAGPPARKRKKRVSAASSSDEAGVSVSARGPTPAYRGSFTARQRDEDLCDVGVPRQGEVVWAKLPKALLSRRDGGVSITHWPAVVKARELQSRAEVRLLEDGDEAEKEGAQQGEGAGDSADKGKGKGESNGDVAQHPDGLKLKKQFGLSTTQEPVFTLSLIGLDDELRRIPLADTLPWLAHMPPQDLMNPNSIKAPGSARHVWDGTKATRDAKLADFTDAEDAATAIALACQIVAHIVASFSPGERYAITPEYIAHRLGSTAEQNASFEEQAARVWAFQSVHFGAELLWAGDMVRLLKADFSDLLGNDADAGADRPFFLRIACIYKQPKTETLKFGGEMWALQDADPPVEEPASNGAAPGMQDGAASTSSAADGATASGFSSTSTPPPAPTPMQQLPRAPAGLRWVQVSSTTAGQVHLDIEFIGGRVHPLPAGLDSPERIAKVRESFAPTERALEDGAEALSLNDEQRAVVLAGLKPTVRMYMRVGTWRADRVVALIAAEKDASKEVAEFFASASNEAASPEGSA